MIQLKAKAAGETITYSWSPTIPDGETITAESVAEIAPATVTAGAASTTAGVVSFQVSGGAVGEIAYLALEVETDGGDVITETARLVVVDRDQGEIITPGELRAELRDVTDSDEALLELITSAREFVEKETGTITIARECVDVLDAWPGSSTADWWDGMQEGSIYGGAASFVALRHEPALSVTSVETRDSAGAATEWASSSYLLDARSSPPRLVLKPGYAWPTPGLPVGGIVITYQAGYADPALIPAAYKRAVRQIAAHWYENRELATPDAVNPVPAMAWSIIRGLRVRRL